MTRAFQFDALSYPAMLWLLAPVVLLLGAEMLAGPAGTFRMSTGASLAALSRHHTHWLVRIPALLRALGLALLVVALAGPLHGYEIRRDQAKVVDILLCVDVSGSMGLQDFRVEGVPKNRLEVTKIALDHFIDGRRPRAGMRYGPDRIGLILYAGYAWTQCPLTLDYHVLAYELAKARVTANREKDGTAIGSAIGLAVRRLSQSAAKSKVIVLLTDGLNNRGDLDPATAAKISAQYGIRIYTIGAGTPHGGRGGVLGFVGQNPQGLDEEMLKGIATTTGGKYYRVTNTDALQLAYTEISQLEATEIDAGGYYQYKERFVPYALAGLAVIAAAMLLRRLWLEPIP